MFQFMDERETAMYVDILSKNFPSLYSKDRLEIETKNRLTVED
jgi:hypothetical protein